MNRPLARVASLEAKLGGWVARHPFALPLVIALVLTTAEALARPGGGQSFSSGSSRSSGSSSSGSSSGGGGIGGFFAEILLNILFEIFEYLIIELCRLLWELTVTYPRVMVPIWVALVVVPLLWWQTTKWLRDQGWVTGQNSAALDRIDAWRWAREWDRDAPLALVVPTARFISPEPLGAEGQVRSLLAKHDQTFATTRFADFVADLYAAVQAARGQGTLASLARHVSPAAQATLAALTSNLTEVRGVGVGTIRFEGSPELSAAGIVTLQVGLRATYTEVLDGGPPRAYFTSELWTFTRPVGTPTSEAALGLDPPEGDDSGWTLAAVDVCSRVAEPQLLGKAEKPLVVTLKTVLDEQAEGLWLGIQKRDPEVTDEALVARVAEVFEALQEALRTPPGSRAQAMLSPTALAAMRYWSETFRVLGQREVIEEAKLRRVELAHVWSFGPVQAVTVRVFVSALDCTVDTTSDAVVSGSRTERRAFSEYWTFVRPSQPVTGSGERAWLLARIEMDRSFQTSG